MQLPLRRDKRFRQGIYQPEHMDKFIGNKLPIFRSGLELKFFRFADNNSNIIKWSSESVIIPYFDPIKNRQRKYYIDNFVMIKEGDVIKKYLVEVKPHKQTMPPKDSKRRKKSHLLYEMCQWKTNESKFAHAREYAKKHGMEFIIITEKELG